jgi:hypothetical protein
MDYFSDRYILRLDVFGHQSNLTPLRPPTRG